MLTKSADANSRRGGARPVRSVGVVKSGEVGATKVAARSRADGSRLMENEGVAVTSLAGIDSAVGDTDRKARGTPKIAVLKAPAGGRRLSRQQLRSATTPERWRCLHGLAVLHLEVEKEHGAVGAGPASTPTHGSWATAVRAFGGIPGLPSTPSRRRRANAAASTKSGVRPPGEEKKGKR